MTYLILYINELLDQRKTDKLKDYLSPIIDKTNRTHKVICKNPAVDAIANHYDEIARSKNVTVRWAFDLDQTLPISESDMCAVMGNLVENAI